jgi:hypothetical protein
MEDTIVQPTRSLDDIVDEISLMCIDPLVSKLCKYIETKYKDNEIIKPFCGEKNLLIYKDNEGKKIVRLEPHFEIWNDSSEKEGGNAITSTIEYIIKNHNTITFSLKTRVLKEENSYETIYELTFNTGNKGMDFNETDGNIDFYNFIEKFDTVNHTMRD